LERGKFCRDFCPTEGFFAPDGAWFALSWGFYSVKGTVLSMAAYFCENIFGLVYNALSWEYNYFFEGKDSWFSSIFYSKSFCN
jgi:hypothetical protein